MNSKSKQKLSKRELIKWGIVSFIIFLIFFIFHNEINNLIQTLDQVIPQWFIVPLLFIAGISVFVRAYLDIKQGKTGMAVSLYSKECTSEKDPKEFNFTVKLKIIAGIILLLFSFFFLWYLLLK